MEIPVINRITELETGMSSLPNPTLLSQILTNSFSGATHNFFKWGALILALLATFSGVIKRIKFLVLTSRRRKNSLSEPLIFHPHSDDEDDNDNLSTDSSSTWSDYRDINSPVSTSAYWEQTDRHFKVKGSRYFSSDQRQDCNLGIRRRHSVGDRDGENNFTWSDLTSGKSVVKLWDNIKLGFNFDECYGDEMSVFHINKEYKIGSSSGGIGQITSVTKGTSVKFWDTRVGCRIPAMVGEWKPLLGQIVGVGCGGVQKVYISHGVRGELTVGDMRKVSSPLGNLTEGDVETWWDANGVNAALEE